MRNRYLPFLLLSFALVAVFGKTGGAQLASSMRLEQLPTSFVENQGQWDSPVKFVVRNKQWSAVLAKDAVTVRQGKGKSAMSPFSERNIRPAAENCALKRRAPIRALF